LERLGRLREIRNYTISFANSFKFCIVAADVRYGVEEHRGVKDAKVRSCEHGRNFVGISDCSEYAEAEQR